MVRSKSGYLPMAVRLAPWVIIDFNLNSVIKESGGYSYERIAKVTRLLDEVIGLCLTIGVYIIRRNRRV